MSILAVKSFIPVRKIVMLRYMRDLIRDLRSKLQGELVIDASSRDFFSTDGSIFKVTPQMVIYPRGEKDVTEVMRKLDQLAEKGKPLAITARGKGTDQAGASLTDGVSLVMTAHMKHLLQVERESVVVQPGMIYSHLQTVLHSHGRFLPPYPASMDFCSIGGALANNSSGEKTLKYGSTRDYVAGLRVVLHNGDVIETYRLNKKQLAAKKKQQDLEGEIYRTVDDLIEQNRDLIEKTYPKVSKNSAGYNLWRIKRSDGSFDLSQLFVGAQGTLGIITEARLYAAPFNPHTTLLVGYFDSIEKLQEAVMELSPLKPSALEVVDKNVLEFVKTNRPSMLEGLLPEKMPELVLLAEFDDEKAKDQKRKAAKAQKIMNTTAFETRLSTAKLEQEQLWRIRRQAAAVIWMQTGAKKALPIIEDGVVPIEKFADFLQGTYKLLDKYRVKVAVWGHAGNGHLHIQPFLDLANIQDRHKIYALANEYYRLVLKLGGSISGEHNDGIMRGPYLKQMYGAELYACFVKIKKTFDPHNILNPRSKLGASQEYGMVHLRREYSMKHLSEHLPGVGSFH